MSSEPPKSHPTSNDEQEEPDSTAPAPPVNPDDTDEQRLEHAQTLYQNRQSAAYACYAAPRLSDQLDKSKRRMIAWECKTCLGDINRPANDRSCSNLLTHAGRCKLKQSKAAKNKTLGLVGILGTGEIDPREVLQRCVIWCAEEPTESQDGIKGDTHALHVVRRRVIVVDKKKEEDANPIDELDRGTSNKIQKTNLSLLNRITTAQENSTIGENNNDTTTNFQSQNDHN
ncbi:hypothetical protein Pst134EA_011681 [Puccinia striiformis f. sp. tritici]|uniref:hypothetical protein n=1 Tax=Puccinia striiformis f. sp. tritici TaxID=168172 RepID=UPI0020073EE9|nr:hypothetical protein Pst134EA_011681 [Puccinia striiformis f. sp. tritici]KAH9468060.1 hypothetical protein Pst134EA_011681 [Puccinia striiformis f. sp. tritici]